MLFVAYRRRKHKENTYIKLELRPTFCQSQARNRPKKHGPILATLRFDHLIILPNVRAGFLQPAGCILFQLDQSYLYHSSNHSQGSKRRYTRPPGLARISQQQEIC